jgi:hypothetical protein
VTESKPMYEKKTIAEPANIPFTPYGKYLRIYKRNFSYIEKRHAIDEELKMKTQNVITRSGVHNQPIRF